MGAANAQVFSLTTAYSSTGGFKNFDSWVYLSHLGFVFSITRNTELIVEGPETVRWSIKTVLIQLFQVKGDFAFEVGLFPFVGSAVREERKSVDKKAQKENGALIQSVFSV
jgi:hypothetical protein